MWNGTVKILRNKIHRLIMAREKAGESLKGVDDEKSYVYSTEGLLSKDMKIRCVFCGKGHWSDDCQKYKN